VLDNYLLYGVVIGQVLAFVLPSFQPGLPLGSLAIGVAAIIVHGKRTDLAGKLAVVLAASIIGYAAPAEHIYQMLAQHDFSANNVSLPLVMAIVTSTLGIEFVIAHAIARPACGRRRGAESDLPEQLPDGDRAGYSKVVVGWLRDEVERVPRQPSDQGVTGRGWGLPSTTTSMRSSKNAIRSRTPVASCRGSS
jgi:hypothetical protein